MVRIGMRVENVFINRQQRSFPAKLYSLMAHIRFQFPGRHCFQILLQPTQDKFLQLGAFVGIYAKKMP